MVKTLQLFNWSQCFCIWIQSHRISWLNTQHCDTKSKKRPEMTLISQHSISIPIKKQNLCSELSNHDSHPYKMSSCRWDQLPGEIWVTHAWWLAGLPACQLCCLTLNLLTGWLAGWETPSAGLNTCVYVVYIDTLVLNWGHITCLGEEGKVKELSL